MDRRTAYERRVWQLAFLLTGGDTRAAAWLVVRILDVRSDLARLDPARLDRLVVLAARRYTPGRPLRTARQPGDAGPQGASASVSPLPPDAAALLREVATLPRQAMEVWILRHLDGLDDVQAARALDCSRTAAARHLEQADELLAPRFAADPARTAAAIALLRGAIARIDPQPIVSRIRQQRRRERRIRFVIIAGVIAIAALAGIAALVGLGLGSLVGGTP